MKDVFILLVAGLGFVTGTFSSINAIIKSFK